MAISEMIRGLMDFDVEPGFSVGARLCVVLDSSGTGYLLIREDRTIVLEWGAGGGMVGVTVSDLSPSEKRAVTRVVRAIRPTFTPDWAAREMGWEMRWGTDFPDGVFPAGAIALDESGLEAAAGDEWIVVLVPPAAVVAA